MCGGEKKRKKKCGTCVEDKKRGKKGEKKKEKKMVSFFLRKFQSIASTPDDISLSSNQDTNQFLV